MRVPQFPRDRHAAYLKSQHPKEADQLESKQRLVKKGPRVGHQLIFQLGGGPWGDCPAPSSRAVAFGNREAIAAYNEHVEANGVFSDGVRSF